MCVAFCVAFSVEPTRAMDVERDAGGGGTGSARRRRARRLSQWHRHERMAVAMALAESTHHSAPRGQKMARVGGWERAVLHGHVPEHPIPQAAGAQYYAMTPDEEAPAAERPPPLREVGPQPGDRRHCGSGFELVVDATVPQLGVEVDVQQCEVVKAVSDWAEARTARARDPGGRWRRAGDRQGNS